MKLMMEQKKHEAEEEHRISFFLGHKVRSWPTFYTEERNTFSQRDHESRPGKFLRRWIFTFRPRVRLCANRETRNLTLGQKNSILDKQQQKLSLQSAKTFPEQTSGSFSMTYSKNSLFILRIRNLRTQSTKLIIQYSESLERRNFLEWMK